MVNFEKELAELWEACGRKLINERLVVNRLEELLLSHGITPEKLIMDVAGGYGFPSIELAQRGWQILYNDGSVDMVARAVANAEKVRAPSYMFSLQSIGCIAAPWQVFEEVFPDESYDALICKGNSLPYAVSWGQGNPDLSKAREQIKAALSHFHRILTPAGILYVDKQPEREEENVEDVGKVDWNGKKTIVTCSFRNDKVHRVRHWTLSTRDKETGEIQQYPSRGYLLLEDELIPLLREVGFAKIEKHILPGDIYEGFVAVKEK